MGEWALLSQEYKDEYLRDVSYIYFAGGISLLCFCSPSHSQFAIRIGIEQHHTTIGLVG